MSNAFGGFFQCLPASASMSRSMAQATAGGTTQLTGLVSSAILVAVLASIGYILEPLPKVRELVQYMKNVTNSNLTHSCQESLYTSFIFTMFP